MQKSANLQLQRNLLPKATRAARRAGSVQRSQRVRNLHVHSRAAILHRRARVLPRAGSVRARLRVVLETAVPAHAQTAAPASRRAVRQPVVVAVAPALRAAVPATAVISRLLVRVLPTAAVAPALHVPAQETAMISRPRGLAPAMAAAVRAQRGPVQVTAPTSSQHVHGLLKAAGAPVRHVHAPAAGQAAGSRMQAVQTAAAALLLQAVPAIPAIERQRMYAGSLSDAAQLTTTGLMPAGVLSA